MPFSGHRADAAATVALALALTALVGCGSGEPAADPAATGASGGDPRWEIVDLGTAFGDGEWAEALALNDAGQIAGNRESRAESAQPAVWADGKLTLVAPGRECGVATAINDAGDVVGWRCSDEAIQDGFLWRRGETIVLPALGRAEWESHHVPSDVNARGQVAGTSAYWGDDEDPSTWDEPYAWLWEDGKFTDLGTLGGAWSIAHALDDDGAVVGESGTKDGQTHAFLWRDGVLTDLGTLPGHVTSVATAINARGQVVGVSSAPDRGPSEAFLWENGRMTALTPAAGTVSRANDVNDRGQVVGESDATSAWPHAFVWEDGKLTDLGTLPRHRTSSAVAINDRGQILGWSEAKPGGPRHVVLWTFR